MTIKELISELQKYPNQNAEVNFISNLVDIDDETFDTHNCSIDFSSQDVKDYDTYDIYIYKENAFRELRIHDLLADNDKLNIKLDKNDEFANIVITNDNDEVLREIQVNGIHGQSDNISIILSKII